MTKYNQSMAPVARFTSMALPNGLPSEVEDDPLNQELGFIYINSESKDVRVSQGDGSFVTLAGSGGGTDTFTNLTVTNELQVETFLHLPDPANLRVEGDAIFAGGIQVGSSGIEVTSGGLNVIGTSAFEDNVDFNKGLTVIDGDINLNTTGVTSDVFNIRRDVNFLDTGSIVSDINFNNTGTTSFNSGFTVNNVAPVFNEGLVTAAIGGVAEIGDPWTMSSTLPDVTKGIGGSETSGIIVLKPVTDIPGGDFLTFTATSTTGFYTGIKVITGDAIPVSTVVLTPLNQTTAAISDRISARFSQRENGTTPAKWEINTSAAIPGAAGKTYTWAYQIYGNRTA